MLNKIKTYYLLIAYCKLIFNLFVLFFNLVYSKLKQFIIFYTASSKLKLDLVIVNLHIKKIIK